MSADPSRVTDQMVQELRGFICAPAAQGDLLDCEKQRIVELLRASCENNDDKLRGFCDEILKEENQKILEDFGPNFFEVVREERQRLATPSHS